MHLAVLNFFKLTVIYFSKENEPKDKLHIEGIDEEFTPDPTHRFGRYLEKVRVLFEVEVYDDLSIDLKSPNYYRKKVNGSSYLIVALDDISSVDTPSRKDLKNSLMKIFEWEKVDQADEDGIKQLKVLRNFLKFNFKLPDSIYTANPVRSGDNRIISLTSTPEDGQVTVSIEKNDKIATMKINGCKHYEFVVEKDNSHTAIYTSNIISLSVSDDSWETDADVALSDYQGRSKDKATDPYGPLDNKDLLESTGLKGFEDVDEISIVCAPNQGDIPGLAVELINHCERLKDRFAILQEDQAKAYSIGVVQVDRESKYAATYLPWLKIIDPLTKAEKLIPPGGHVAGIYARTDIERGVHKAPANEIVRGVTALQVQLTKEDQAILNPRGINIIRSFVGRGILVWGARTISKDPDWKYINVRRLFLYIEESIEESTQWLVFEPNSERLWSRVIVTLTPFLSRLRKEGALMGTTDEEAFFVHCDRSTMTQDDIDNGRLIVVIGAAPVKPAEFVIFRISQTKAGATIEEF